MALILALETSGKSCSVALGRDGQVLAERHELSDQYVHSEKLHLFIEECCAEAGVALKEIGAVAIDKGPGSYTGLRIGTAAAKGLCYALDIPLIAIGVHELLLKQFLGQGRPAPEDIILPLIDARRDEVYAAVYSGSGEMLRPVEAQILEESSFENYRDRQKWLVGDGAAKAVDLLGDERARLTECIYPQAAEMLSIAEVRLAEGQVEDTAYFEPFYLKDFIAGKPKKLL